MLYLALCRGRGLGASSMPLIGGFWLRHGNRELCTAAKTRVTCPPACLLLVVAVLAGISQTRGDTAPRLLLGSGLGCLDTEGGLRAVESLAQTDR